MCLKHLYIISSAYTYTIFTFKWKWECQIFQHPSLLNWFQNVNIIEFFIYKILQGLRLTYLFLFHYNHIMFLVFLIFVFNVDLFSKVPIKWYDNRKENENPCGFFFI
jgi:DMSO reductase anchor subunit